MKKLIILVEATSLPLIFLSILYIITCYQMLLPEIAFMAARKVHTDKILRILIIIFGFLHSYAGLLIICERRVENVLMKKFFKFLITVFLVPLVTLLIFLELTV